MCQGRSQVVIWKTSPGRENSEKSLPLRAVLSWEMWAIFRRRDLGQGRVVVFSRGDPQSGLTVEGHLPAAFPAAQGISVSFLKGFPGGTVVKNLFAMQEMWETWVQFLGQEDRLEEEMATHSSILAWRIPWMEEPGRATDPSPWDRKESDMTRARMCTHAIWMAHPS